jgi:hypothetical protein
LIIHSNFQDAFLHSEKGNRFCEENIYLQTEDKIWLSPFGITRDTVNYRADEVFGRMYSFRPFTINSDYNGKKTNVGSAVEKLKIVFRSCPVEYYKQQPVKGFRTNVLSKGEQVFSDTKLLKFNIPSGLTRKAHFLISFVPIDI